MEHRKFFSLQIRVQIINRNINKLKLLCAITLLSGMKVDNNFNKLKYKIILW
jgi:hypothetical protein